MPAIVSDACAARDSVVPGATGLLFRNADTDALARAIGQLNEAALAARLGQAAYERFWAAPPTPAAHVDRLEDCYREILSG